MRGSFVVVGLLALVSSCGFNPHPKDGTLPCDKGCPSGYACRISDNRCWSGIANHDASSSGTGGSSSNVPVGTGGTGGMGDSGGSSGTGRTSSGAGGSGGNSVGGAGGGGSGGIGLDGGIGGSLASGGSGVGGSRTGGTGGTTSSGGTTTTGGITSSGGTSSSGDTRTTGGVTTSGGVPASGGSATTGGVISTGGHTAAGGTTGTSTMTLAQACTHNCGLASGLSGCSTTEAVCEQSCMTTFDNTSAVNSDLGRQYKDMMVCVATDPAFSTSAGFVCAKPNSPLNLWSPVVDPSINSPCKQQICDWNCNDATHGDMDPWVDILCVCTSV
jgi:hypothetical protein